MLLPAYLIRYLPEGMFTKEQLTNIFLKMYGISFLISWVCLTLVNITDKVILTDDFIIFKHAFKNKKISWNSIVDWSHGIYSHDNYSMGFPSSFSSTGEIVKIWYKRNNGKFAHYKKYISGYKNSNKLFDILKEKIKRSEEIQKVTRYSFFGAHNIHIFIALTILIVLSTGGSLFLMLTDQTNIKGVYWFIVNIFSIICLALFGIRIMAYRTMMEISKRNQRL